MTSAAHSDPLAEGLIQDGRARRMARLGSRELWASATTGGLVLAVAAALIAGYDSGRDASPLLALALVAAYALAYNVEFEVGPGLAVATQLAFVPISSCCRSSSCRSASPPA